MAENKSQHYNDFIVETVKQLKEKGNFSWRKVTEIVKNKYPHRTTSREQVRSRYRRALNKSNIIEKQLRSNAENNYKREGLDSLEERLLYSLRRKQEVKNLAVKLGLTFEELLTEITKIELKGYNVDKWLENGKSFIKLDRDIPTVFNQNTYNFKVDKQIKFLVVSDTHFGHKQSQKEYFKSLVEAAYERGVRKVIHAGDVFEGHYMAIRPTSIRELEAVGFDEQLELALNWIPELEGLEYFMISGNHDFSFERNAYANPVRTLAKIRKDIKYLGHNFAKIWINDTIDIALVHPTDGIGQNYGLKLRQHIDRNTEERLARFIFMAHYHKFTHLRYKGIDSWIIPAMIKQSEFMTDKNLESVVGGIIMTLNLDKHGELVSFIPEYFFLEE